MRSNSSRYHQIFLFFLLINSAWCKLNNCALRFLTIPAVLKIFRIQEKPGCLSLFFKIPQKLQIFLKSGAQLFELYQVLVIYKKSETHYVYLS